MTTTKSIHVFSLLILFHLELSLAAEANICSDDLTCLNNGKCEKSESSDGVSIDVCYCTDMSEGRFVGIDCSIKAPIESSDWCNNYGDFCVVGRGTCNRDPKDPKVCKCKPDYTGKYCELEISASQIQGHIISDKDTIEESCNLECTNDGVCTFGYRDPTATEITQNLNVTGADVTTNYQHCQCPHKYFGKLCEDEALICGRDDDNNPEHFCHNGGTCEDISGIPDMPSYVCNCNGKHYTGRFCEYADVKICNGNDPEYDTRTFCTNGGDCARLEEDDDAIWTCICKEGFEGKHCEVPSELLEKPAVSATYHSAITKGCSPDRNKCKNGGECYSGVKDYSNTAIGNLFGKDNQDLEHINKVTNEYFEHCKCPKGFTGVHCEFEFQTCPDSEHICFHGSTCIGDETKCSCNDYGPEDTPPTTLAGKYCQHKATTKCGTKSCFNGGTCDQTNYSCDCPEGWHGPYCSFSDTVVLEDDDLLTQSLLSENYSEKLNPDLIMISGVLAFVGLLVVIVAVAVTDHSKEESYPLPAVSGRNVPPITSFPLSRTHRNDGQPAAENNGSANGDAELEKNTSANGGAELI